MTGFCEAQPIFLFDRSPFPTKLHQTNSEKRRSPHVARSNFISLSLWWLLWYFSSRGLHEVAELSKTLKNSGHKRKHLYLFGGCVDDVYGVLRIAIVWGSNRKRWLHRTTCGSSAFRSELHARPINFFHCDASEHSRFPTRNNRCYEVRW